MKREIKFRALSMCKGERWVYGDLRHYARNPHTEKWTIHDPSTGLETDIDETTIGQFSGLYDKNGKEIYEGDVVKHPYIDPIFRDLVEMKDGKGVTSEVVFHDGAFVIKYDDEDFIYLDAFTRHGYAEVIGNIHDNKDLL